MVIQPYYNPEEYDGVIKFFCSVQKNGERKRMVASLEKESVWVKEGSFPKFCLGLIIP